MPAVLLHSLAVLAAARQLTLVAQRRLRVSAAQLRLTPRPQAARRTLRLRTHPAPTLVAPRPPLLRTLRRVFGLALRRPRVPHRPASVAAPPRLPRAAPALAVPALRPIPARPRVLLARARRRHRPPAQYPAPASQHSAATLSSPPPARMVAAA
ncbi:hypothetical protein B0H13DRAFT_2023824 [Mycena leptocephala]|nr:hypothetical protein B0H13DRAFT_2023824 [Mycena leptocephala]